MLPVILFPIFSLFSFFFPRHRFYLLMCTPQNQNEIIDDSFDLLFNIVQSRECHVRCVVLKKNMFVSTVGARIFKTKIPKDILRLCSKTSSTHKQKVVVIGFFVVMLQSVAS